MNVSLPRELEKMVQAKVQSGRYSSANEVVWEALRLLDQQDNVRAAHVSAIRSRIDEGLAALDRGEEVDGETFMQFMPEMLDSEGLGSDSQLYLQEAGYRVARQVVIEFVETFRAIAQNPDLGHKREDLAQNRAILFWTMSDYLIVCQAGRKPVPIVVIAHGSRDVAQIINRSDL